MERLVRFFVERHLLVNVITAALVVVGLSAVLRMPVEGFPDVEMPRFIIGASLPGASARDVETKITIPIEEMLAEIDSLDTYHTVVTDNRSVTTIEMDDDTPRSDLIEKEREIRNGLEAINDFPPEMIDDPSLQRMEPQKFPVLEVALAGPSDLLPDAARMLERRLERLPGVGAVNVVGLSDPELRVLVDPDRARVHGVTLLDVVRALERRNVSSTGGTLETAQDQQQVALWGRFADPFEAGDVILRFSESGGALRVSDVARLELGREETDLVAGTNGRVGLSLIVMKRKDADVVEVRAQVQEVLDTTALGAVFDWQIVNDQSFEVRNRLDVIASNGAMGVALVAGIVFLFLAPSAAIWVCVGIPLVILAVLAVMPAFDMGINFISTVAFVVILGLLVDDAVVVAEKILLHRQDGQSAREAAVHGGAVMARPVLAAAITTVLAFAPMYAFGGMPGRMIWQIPAVVILALVLSLLECFLILPSHMSMVRSDAQPRPKRPFMLRLESGYRAILERCIQRRRYVIAGYAVVFVLIMGAIAPRMSFEFMPQDSSPGLALRVSMPPGTPLEQTEGAVRAIERQIAPLVGTDLLATTSRVGHQETMALDREYGSAGHEGLISAYIDLSSNQRTSSEWVEVLKDSVQLPADAEVIYEILLDGPPGLEPIAIHVLSNDDFVRRETARAASHFIEDIDGVVDVDINERPGIRQVDLNLDYERLARRGLDAQDVGLTLKTAFFGAIASEIRDLDETTNIRVLFDPRTRRSLDALLETPLRNSRGELVALRDVVDPVEQDSVASIFHREGMRSATVTGGFSAQSRLTSIDVAERLERDFVPLYAGRTDVEILISGEVEQSRRATGDTPLVALISIGGIGAVIAIMLGSFLEAIFVIAIIPFAMAAVILTFFAHGMHLSMFAVIGTLGLAGVVVNSAIVMVDAVHRAQDEVRGDDDVARLRTMLDAIVGRLRPILVTSLSTLGGLLPTAYGFGGYDYVLSPLSLAMGWGLALSTGVTLFLLPCLYVTANDITRAIDRRRQREAKTTELPLRRVS